MVYNFREFIFILTAVNVPPNSTQPFPTDPDQPDMSENGWNIWSENVGIWSKYDWKRFRIGRNFESHKKQFSFCLFVFYPTLIGRNRLEQVEIGRNPCLEMLGAPMGRPLQSM